MRYFKRNKNMTIFLIIISIFIYLNYSIVFETTKEVDRNNKFYVNDLYTSNNRIYKNELTSDEKKAYNELLNMSKKRIKEKSINLNNYDEKEPVSLANSFVIAHYALIVDHPELLQYAGMYYKYDDSILQVGIQYAIDNQVTEEINKLKIQTIVNKIKMKTKNMSDLEKIRYVYEWIGKNYKYDTVFTYMAKNQSIYNVFIRKNAVCAGFAKASLIIFQNIGIDAISVLGDSGGGPHMWNAVKYKGKYYYFDSTVAASIRNVDSPNYYDGLKQTKMNDYTLDNEKWVPKVETSNALFE